MLGRAPSLADLTTLRVGGPVQSYVEVSSESELIDAVREADASRVPLLVIGGGSNLLVADEGFAGIVVRDGRHDLEKLTDVPGTVGVRVTAGHDWDRLVEESVENGWAGAEALSGIPGTAGAAPVQNIGAYGSEVARVVQSVRCWDRAEARVRRLTAAELAFGYRTSLLKRSMSSDGDGPSWHPTPRYVVLDVDLRMQTGELSLPVAYSELARQLGVEVGDRVPVARVRAAVLELRGGKGMLADDAGAGVAPDHDRWSAGSFFTNPVLSSEAAEHLPAEAPRFAAGGGSSAAVAGRVKTSAAWLIEHAGFAKGFGTSGDASAARLSTRHTLALTNRGSATAAGVVELARTVRDGVRDRFGVALEPEPVLVGVAL
jgi:UDP-N-acetylmuramate dehydrogenase